MPYTGLAAMFAFAVGFYKAGEVGARSGGANYGGFWAVLSLAVSALSFFVLKVGLIPAALMQLGLFLGIGVVRAARS